MEVRTVMADAQLHELGDAIGVAVREIEDTLRERPHHTARVVSIHEGLEVAWRDVTPGAWGFMLRGSRGDWVPWHSAPLLMRVMAAPGIPVLVRDVKRQVQACLDNGPRILAALRAWDREPSDAPGCSP